MTPGRISKRIIADRLEYTAQMLAEIRSLPLEDSEVFFADARNLHTAESCLRRGLESLLDAGRHVLAKGFSVGASEYKEIAERLGKSNVLNPADTSLLSNLAGYRNRLVHFYHEVGPDELYNLCATRLGDIEHLAEELKTWLKAHPEKLDNTL
jgi:uncharacterized protein YutE (UPF0331/DUF86 family)